MPYLRVKLSTEVSHEAAEKIGVLLTDLTAKVLGKKRELTAATIEPIPAGNWYIGGKSLSGSGQTSFYLEIKVTEGTNTKDEKASYSSKVFAGMSEILGPLAPASYIVIQEVRADSWGYEGKTQEFRYISGKAL